MEKKIVAGQTLPLLQSKNIHGRDVFIPDPTRWTHLQFRRFAGCPVCNTHLQSFVARHQDIVDAGVQEIVVFHSSEADLLPYQGQFPFDVIGDPTKMLYRKFGVEASISAFFSLKAWSASMKGLFMRHKPQMEFAPEGGVLGLPADFLIAPDGRINAVHYGAHAFDQWSVDELLELRRGRNEAAQARVEA